MRYRASRSRVGRRRPLEVLIRCESNPIFKAIRKVDSYVLIEFVHE